jgi:hypothetical protein
MAIKSPLGVAFLGLGRMGETHLRNLLGLRRQSRRGRGSEAGSCGARKDVSGR